MRKRGVLHGAHGLHGLSQRAVPPLQAEVKRRAESDKQLQSHFEGEIRALAERAASQHADLQVRWPFFTC